MNDEDSRKISINDLKISKSRKDGFLNDEYSFMIPNNFSIKFGEDDRDFIAYLGNECDDFENACVVVYSSDVTPYQDVELYSIDGFLLAYDYSYWLVIYNDFKALFGDSYYYEVELESGFARVVCAYTEYFTSLYFVTCINSGYKQIHIQFNDVLGSLDEMLEKAVQIMNGFKVEKEIVVVNDINDERYLNGKVDVDDWISNLDKVGKDLWTNLGVRAKVEILKKTKLLTEGKEYNDDFSKIIKQLCDNFVKEFDESLKKIEVYLDKVKGKIDKKKVDVLYRKITYYVEKYKKYSLTTDDGVINIESNAVSKFYKKIGISEKNDDVLDEVSKWKDEVLEIENIMNNRLDEVTNKFNENFEKELEKLEKKKNLEIEKLGNKLEKLKSSIEKNDNEIASLSFINFMKKNELKNLNEKMIKEIDEVKKKIDKVNFSFDSEIKKIKGERDGKLDNFLELEKEKFVIPGNPDVLMEEYEKDRINIPDKEYYEKLKVKESILKCLNSSFNPLSVLKMKELDNDLEQYSNLFMFSILDELIRSNKIVKTMVSGTAYFEISDKSKYEILGKIILKDKNIKTRFSKDRELVLNNIKLLVDSELKVSFDKLVDVVCSKDISVSRLLQVLKSFVDEKVLFKQTIDGVVIYFIDCKRLV